MSILEIFKNINTELIGYVLLFPVFFVWVLGMLHTTIDIVRRTNSLLVELFCMLLAAILGPIGWLIYLVIRPYFTLEEKQVHQSILANTQECLKCGTLNLMSHKYCTACGEDLKIKCKECKKEYYKGYDFCPYCSAPNIEIDD